MSGDVQPRKRKDKKRKKEEEPSPTPPVHVFSKEPSEDVNIHIHKEEGTGGGICAKIIFFILFSALFVLIGLIITEHRGLTDLDVAESESKYSQIFEGWVDNEKHGGHHTLDDHDNEHFDDEEQEDDAHTLDDHDNEHMDDEETDEQSEEEHTLDDHDNEHFDDDQSSPVSEENEGDVEYQQGESQSQEEYKGKFRNNRRYRRQVSEEDDDVDNITDSEEEQEVDNSKIYINTKVEYNDEEGVDSKDEDDIEDRSENMYEDEDNSKIQQEDNMGDSAEEQEDDDNFNDSADENDLNEHSEPEDIEVDSKISDEEIDAEYDSQVDEDDNAISSTSRMVDDVIKNDEYISEEAADEVDNESVEEKDRGDTSREKDAEQSEKSEDNEENKAYMNNNFVGVVQKINEKSEIPKKSASDSNESTEENTSQQTENKNTEHQDKDRENDYSGGSDSGSLSNMIIKAIIGAAIMAVGHFVLVKKWKSDSPDETSGGSEEIHIDLTRRNTLIAPPPLQEIEHDVESGDKEYYDVEEADDGSAVGSRSVTDVARKKYEQLRSSYSRSISPESDIGHYPKGNESEDELEIEDIEEEELEEEEEEEDVENLQGEEMEDVEDEDIDDEDYENEEYEEDDDEELMKKLEAKYGKLQLEPKTKERTPSTDLDESDSEKLSDDNNEYEFAGVTNKDDWQIRKELDEAQLNLRNNAAYALKMFEKVLEKYPSSPRGFYGLAQALDALADKEKSNELLEEAISNYFKVSEMKNVPNPLYKASLERCIDRARFRGKYGNAIRVHLKLINRFPDQPEYRNQLTITYLTIGKIEEARSVLEETLQKWPLNGCALVHYGFIWKTTDNNLKKGVFYMQKGIDTKDPCTIDGRFYFHLGDGYSRLGDSKKALKIYQEGVDHKLFLSKYQRSLYNVPRLTARPWWQNNQLPKYNLLLEDLEKHWITIKNEGLAVLNQQGVFQDESENLKDTGDWKQFELFARGRRNIKNCNKTPFTCKLVGSHTDASGCRRGQTKFSVMHPGTHVWSHCGPTNCRLRIHLGLKVPSKTFIRVGDTVRSWNAGNLLIFDDSFEHEVWHNGTDIRLVLIVDVWHPELTMTEKENLSSL